MMSGLIAWDVRLFVLINQEWTSGFLDTVMPFLTDFDHWRIPVIVLLLVALARGSRATRLAILFAILAVVVADQLSSAALKPMFDRTRPFHVVAGTRQLIDAHSTSFPSSHAANTFAAGIFLALRFARMRWILIVPLVVSYSRVYVGVHYPLDVAGGAAVGAIIGGSFAALERASRVRLDRWLRPPRGRAGGDDEDGAEDEGDEVDAAGKAGKAD
jgi:undecaprenyl-diphosphatase